WLEALGVLFPPPCSGSSVGAQPPRSLRVPRAPASARARQVSPPRAQPFTRAGAGGHAVLPMGSRSSARGDAAPPRHSFLHPPRHNFGRFTLEPRDLPPASDAWLFSSSTLFVDPGTRARRAGSSPAVAALAPRLRRLPGPGALQQAAARAGGLPRRTGAAGSNTTESVTPATSTHRGSASRGASEANTSGSSNSRVTSLNAWE
ncbi:unnamed protein product, partial [Prorocentrum cordatum]